MRKAPQYTIFKVTEKVTLLPFIMESLQGISRNKAKAILQGNGVRVNKKIVSQHDFELTPGMVVEISKKKDKQTLNSRFVKLVYEDHHIIVIEKAPGILSMANNHSAFCVKTILDEYLHRSHQKCTAHVVHRLDRDTSGLMVYAKNMKAEQILEDNWHDIVTDRRYIAVLSGKMEQKKGMVESWLKENKQMVTYSSPVEGDGKYALTRFRTIKTNEKHSLVELKLETGRKNQIRVHMADISHPVCGDEKYGNGDNPRDRLCLHAYRLCFYHPMTSELLRFETPIPKAFKEILSSKEKEN